MKRFILLAVALAMVCAGTASAQSIGSRSATGSAALEWVWCVNATDSLIADGVVVMTDTTAASGTNVKRFAVRPWDGTCLNRHRILGLAMGNIARSSRGGNGSVLCRGYHARARIGATGLAVNTPLRTLAGVQGSLTAATDTVMLRIGTFIGYNTDATATFPRTGKVMITRSMAVHANSLP